MVRAALRVPLPAARRRRRTRGIELELRQAHRAVARARRGGAAGGTARYVDSSVERLQVKVHGHDRRPPRRHLQRPRACRCTRPARNGEFVAGVRYRAWQPPSCLHPTIRVHAPLRVRHRGHLDRTARSAAARITSRIRAGATTTTFPVNAYEAESAAACALLPPRPHARAVDPCAAAGSRSHPATSPRNHASTLASMPAARRLEALVTRFDEPTPGSDLLAGYAAPEGRYDELLAAPARPRPHWDAFLRALAERSERELSDTLSQIERADPRERRHLQRLRRSEGRRPALGARSAAADPRRRRVAARSKPASRSARGCSTRPRRLYGPQELLTSGALPPRGGVRPPRLPARRCRASPAGGAAPATSTRPTWRASPDGRWWVVDDRTQAPSGVGLRAREPARRLARVPADVPRAARAAPGGVLRALRDIAAALGARGARRGRRASCCSRRGRTTRPISSTRYSRATSASRWSKAAT